MLPQFLTVPEELIEVANRLVLHFDGFGYTVKAEKRNLEFPHTPTMVCKRDSTTVIVEVASAVPLDRVREWVAYGRSCSADTRVALGLPSSSVMPASDQALLSDMGVGLYLVGPISVVDLIPATDLALNLAPPPLNRYPNKVRKALGSSYEQIHRGQWREGFEDACLALEDEARKYLKRHIGAGRISLVGSKGKVHTPTPKQVDKMTLGQLKDAFLAIRYPNSSDTKVGAVLKRLNPDRIRVAHKKKSPAAEAALRRNVGKQMWTIVAGLNDLVS